MWGGRTAGSSENEVLPGEEISEELEFLNAVYSDCELSIEERGQHKRVIELCLHPSTGGEKHKQYVSLRIQFAISEKYPGEVPQIMLLRPRGVTSDHLEEIRQKMVHAANEAVGTPMIYQLCEMAREELTERNRPGDECPICLELFHADDPPESFTITSCEHYFHACCLADYIDQQTKLIEKELELVIDLRRHDGSLIDERTLTVTCPQCREPFDYDLAALHAAPRPSAHASAGDFSPSAVVIPDSVQQMTLRMTQVLLERSKREEVQEASASEPNDGNSDSSFLPVADPLQPAVSTLPTPTAESSAERNKESVPNGAPRHSWRGQRPSGRRRRRPCSDRGGRDEPRSPRRSGERHRPPGDDGGTGSSSCSRANGVPRRPASGPRRWAGGPYRATGRNFFRSPRGDRRDSPTRREGEGPPVAASGSRS